jgi:CLIP-associating protein 1/2
VRHVSLPIEADAKNVVALVPALVRALQHARADIRKGVVFCLVEIWIKVGDELMRPYLGGLTDSQQRLLGIYLARCSPASQSSAV